MPHDLEELRIFQQMVAAFDTPAFMRRAKDVEAAWEHLLDRCQRMRDEWLTIPKLRLGVLYALAGDAESLRPFLAAPEQATELQQLHEEWQPLLRLPVPPATSPRQIQHALRQLATSFERFNRRWECFVNDLDLTEANRLREGYNRHYVMEKECAVRSASVARAGFRLLGMVTVDDLRIRFPLLPVTTEVIL